MFPYVSMMVTVGRLWGVNNCTAIHLGRNYFLHVEILFVNVIGLDAGY